MELVLLVLILYWLFKAQVKAVVKQSSTVAADALDSVLTIAGNASREARKDSLDDLRKLGESMGITNAQSMSQRALAKEIDKQLKS